MGRNHRGIVWGCVLLAVTFVAGGCVSGSSSPGSSTGSSVGKPVPTTPAENTPDPDLFSRRQAVLRDVDGETCTVCLWIADTSVERRTGLMGVTTLGEADGMAFLFDPPTSGTFWMKDTLIDLEIAFFDSDRNLVGSDVMTPCVTEPCPLYGPNTPYSTAVEFPLGHLAELGIDEVANIEMLDTPCGAELT